MRRDDFRYHPYYCEENARLLVAEPQLRAVRRWVVFVTNRRRVTLMYHQRAGGDGPVVWDYHVFVVVLASRALQVLDLDTTLGFPVALDAYLQASFPSPQDAVGARYQPWFRVVAGEELVRRFASDRRHMRDADGRWQAPPPPWAPIQGAGAPHDLDRWLDLDAPEPGVVCDLTAFRSTVAAELLGLDEA